MKVMLIQYAKLRISKSSNLTKIAEAQLILEKPRSNLEM